MKEFLAALSRKIRGHSDASLAADIFYRRLLRWGRFSGLSHPVTETPEEYGARLGERFPAVQKEINRIIRMHEATYYGAILPGGHQISLAKQSLQKIRTPRLWFARIQSLFFDRRFE